MRRDDGAFPAGSTASPKHPRRWWKEIEIADAHDELVKRLLPVINRIKRERQKQEEEEHSSDLRPRWAHWTAEARQALTGFFNDWDSERSDIPRERRVVIPLEAIDGAIALDMDQAMVLLPERLRVVAAKAITTFKHEVAEALLTGTGRKRYPHVGYLRQAMWSGTQPHSYSDLRGPESIADRLLARRYGYRLETLTRYRQRGVKHRDSLR
jgi:hypothetical protein